MDEKVRKEFESLKQMARNWKEGFRKNWLVLGENNDDTYREFIDEINIHLLPYAGRLVATGYLTNEEAGELIDYFFDQIKELQMISDLAQWEKNNPIVTTL